MFFYSIEEYTEKLLYVHRSHASTAFALASQISIRIYCTHKIISLYVVLHTLEYVNEIFNITS